MRWVALALVLAGCGGAEPVEQPVVSFRDQSVPIASQVDVETGSMDGAWVVRQSFDGDRFAAGVTLTWASQPEGGLAIQADLPCDPLLSTEACIPGRRSYQALPDGPSRWAAFTPLHPDEPRDVDLWILWVDADRRTAAIGVPSGEIGFILDRNATGGDDRIAAARDIMAWMGYRVDEMEGL